MRWNAAGGDRARKLLSYVNEPEFRLLRRSADADPYGVFRDLHDAGPVSRSRLGYWFVTGHAQARTLLEHSRVGAITSLSMRPDFAPGSYPVLEQLHAAWALFSDGPLHAERRDLLATAAGSMMREVVERDVPQLARSFVEGIDWTRPVDVVAELARPFPVHVLGRVLGLPEQDLPYLGRLTTAMSEVLEPFFGSNRLRAAEAAATELRDYLDCFVGSGAIGALLQGGPGGIGLANAALLTASGHETTASLLGMSILELLRDRSALDDLLGADKLHTAVEELLRFTTPIQLVARRVRQAFTYEDIAFADGDILLIWLAAANRDPTVFANPNRLALSRLPNPHLAFSAGLHHCFGAALSRAEARAVLHQLRPHMADLEVDEESVAWARKRTVRSLIQLVVRPRQKQAHDTS